MPYEMFLMAMGQSNIFANVFYFLMIKIPTTLSLQSNITALNYAHGAFYLFSNT